MVISAKKKNAAGSKEERYWGRKLPISAIIVILKLSKANFNLEVIDRGK